MREPSESDKDKGSKVTVGVSFAVMALVFLFLQIIAISGFIVEGATAAPIFRQIGAILVGGILALSFFQDRKVFDTDKDNDTDTTEDDSK